MAKEIERKYLVESKSIVSFGKGTTIKQGYFPTSDKTVVRVRIAGDKAYLTIKGENKGPVRTEFEYSIPSSDADKILEELCEKPFIEKTRYIINHSGAKWEVDIFEGDNEGLIVAEIEIESEDQEIDIPNWILKEVTDDPRYFNSNLIKHPFKKW